MTNSNSLLKLKESEPPGAPSFVVVLIDVKENLNFKCFRHQKYIIVKFDERNLYGFLAFFTHLFFMVFLGYQKLHDFYVTFSKDPRRASV